MYDRLYTRMEWHDVTILANLIGLNQTTKQNHQHTKQITRACGLSGYMKSLARDVSTGRDRLECEQLARRICQKIEPQA